MKSNLGGGALVARRREIKDKDLGRSSRTDLGTQRAQEQCTKGRYCRRKTQNKISLEGELGVRRGRRSAVLLLQAMAN